MTSWYKSKSNIVAIVAAVLNIVSAVTGYTLPEYFNEAIIALWAIFMRQGVAKSGPEK